MRERFNAMKKTCDQERVEYEKVISEKDATIKELNTRLENAKLDVVKMCNDEVFIPKLWKGVTGPTKSCETSGCDRIDVDLIKCNMCGILCCEDCVGVKVAKLRPVMNQCKTLYITCSQCYAQLNNKSNINAYDILKDKVEALNEELGTCEKENEKLAHQVHTLNEHQSSLQQLLDERETALHDTEAKVVSMEQNQNAPVPNTVAGFTGNIEELINKRFDNFDKRMDEIMEKKIAGVLQIPVTAGPSNSGESRKSFSAAVGGSPATVTQISDLKTSRNAELVEKQEQERRMNNIIIHGISEETTGENENSQDSDRTFIKSFLEAIEVNIEPKQIIRIGNKTADKKRPVKVILKNSDDKEQVMAGLTKLKNATPDLRGISVRDDYTQEERKLIQTMHEEAKR